MTQCKLCNQSFAVITNTHLAATHHTTIRVYARRFGNRGVGFARYVFEFSKNDPRYIAWRRNLLRRPPPWSKGYTKDTHPNVAKISRTFKRKRIDNFAAWRDEARRSGKIPLTYPDFEKGERLAFFIGLVLGDGHIEKHERTESLTLTLGTDKPRLWRYAARVVEDTFNKKPYIRKQKSECMRIRIHQKNISSRLEIPTGNRTEKRIRFPKWIRQEKKFLIACLKGLYEAEGSFSIHPKTSTYNLAFSNRNVTLLNVVENALKELGFHPERREVAVRLRKKAEALKFEKLILFRKRYSY